MTHLIGKQHLNVVYNGPKGRAVALQQEMSQQFREDVIPELSNLFDQLVGDEEWIRLDKLELELGDFSRNELKGEWKMRLLTVLEKAIKEQIHKHFEVESAEEISIIPSEHRTIELLQFFLEKGYLPWWGKLNSPSELSKQVHTSVKAKSASRKKLRLWLKSRPKAIKRLVWQFEDDLLEELTSTNDVEQRLRPQSLLKNWSEWISQLPSLITQEQEKLAQTSFNKEKKEGFTPPEIDNQIPRLMRNTFWYLWIWNWTQTPSATRRWNARIVDQWFQTIANILNIPEQQLVQLFQQTLTEKWHHIANSGWTTYERELPKHIQKKDQAETKYIERQQEAWAEKKEEERTNEENDSLLQQDSIVSDEEVKAEIEMQQSLAEISMRLSKPKQLENEDEAEAFELKLDEVKQSEKKEKKSEEQHKKETQQEPNLELSDSEEFKEKKQPPNLQGETNSSKENILGETKKIADSPDDSEISKETPLESIPPEKTLTEQLSKPSLRNKERKTTSASEYIFPEAGIFIDQAGLVILHPFLPGLFEELKLIKDGQFIDESCQIRAVHMLAYLATGEMKVPEYSLSLHKLLCNIPLDQEIESHLVLTEIEKQEAQNLLNAVIKHWTALQDTSIDGLRVNFFMREGKLSKREIGWWLQVEQRVFDLLLNRLPWGIGLVKLSWMPKVLQIDWV